jgi:hypothetical protein
MLPLEGMFLYSFLRLTLCLEPPEEPDNSRLYIGIGVGVVVVLLVSIGIGCCICRSKKDTHRTRSTESDESAISES